MEGMARLAEEECHLLAHMERSTVDPQEVRLVISEPDRSRRLRVVDEQRRSYHARMAQPGPNRKPRNNETPPNNYSSRGNPLDHASNNAEKKRYRKESSYDLPSSGETPSNK